MTTNHPNPGSREESTTPEDSAVPRLTIDLTRGVDEDGDDSFSMDMGWSDMSPDNLTETLGFIVATAIGRIVHTGVSKEIPVDVLADIAHQMYIGVLRGAMEYLPQTLPPEVQDARENGSEDDE